MTHFDDLLKESIELAEKWQVQVSQNMNGAEKEFHTKMDRLLKNENDKVLLIKLLDQCFRSSEPATVANQISHLFSKHGIPEFFGETEKLLIRIFRMFGHHFPALSVPQIISRMRSETAHVIMSAEDEDLIHYLEKRKNENTRVNINFLGEAILGEKEAASRMETYTQALQNPAIEYISVKVSTLYSQISPLAVEHDIELISERLGKLYSLSKEHQFTRPDGSQTDKFVNLDMEEYKDMHITIDVFKETLSQPEYMSVSAGIVLQAYLPDTLDILKDITDWALYRHKKGGAPIKIRLVKGANLEMERIEASDTGWELSTYSKKVDTDTNYKVLLNYAIDPEHTKAVKLGIGSHNLFEIAYATVLAQNKGVSDDITIEMLEGMADSARRTLQTDLGGILLYAPVVKRSLYLNAIAYLVRRLDENTGPNNYLRHAFHLTIGSENWEFIKQQFINSYINIGIPGTTPNRTQDRLEEKYSFKKGTYYNDNFESEIDTDWHLPSSLNFAEQIAEDWKNETVDQKKIPLIIDGKDKFTQREIIQIYDDNDPSKKVKLGACAQASARDLEEALRCASNDEIGWRMMEPAKRHKLLSNAAREFRSNRGRLLAVTAAEVGKIFKETDVEISEAIDFLEYYPKTYNDLAKLENISIQPRGVVAVIAPWNFPIAIPTGGIAAALAAGNNVIFKPSSNALLCGWELCKRFWDAGIPKEVLQFVPSSGALYQEHIIPNPKIDAVIFTGGTDTAQSMLKRNPRLNLFAETGGKNATIVTASSDRDQAVKNVVASAFNNSGQKCSATSLLILEKEVYEDDSFRKTLADAAESLLTGSAWNFKNRLGPMATAPSGPLQKALTSTEKHEHWLVAPRLQKTHPKWISPSIKWGVLKDSFTYSNELFGPHLSVMMAHNLTEAVAMVNGTGFGLTSGIESLDDREITYWKDNIEAGNLYINRSTTGAIVARQPFGGFGLSSFGQGLKAGGANYITQFCKIEDTDSPSDKRMILNQETNPIKLEQLMGSDLLHGHEKSAHALAQCVNSYHYNHVNEFKDKIETKNIRGEDNFVRYLKIKKVLLRCSHKDNLFDVLAPAFACKTLGLEVHLSFDNKKSKVFEIVKHFKDQLIGEGDELIIESEKQMLERLHNFDRLRVSHPDRASDLMRTKAIKEHIYIYDRPPVMEGRIELLAYLKEQTISHSYHRYGNVGGRQLSQKLGR